MQRVTRVDIPENTGDFRLLSRRALNALLELREHHRFMKGLFAWIGFPSLLGEYLGRIFNESKRPPLYLLKGFAPSALHGSAGDGSSATQRPTEALHR